MANTLDGGSFREIWAANMQAFNEKLDVFRMICDFTEEQNLKMGDTLNKPYRSAMTPQSYTRGTAVTIQDLTNTNEQLTVTQAFVDPFYVDDLDELQSSYSNVKEYSYDSSVDLNNWMDGDVLGEYDNATSTVSNADITSGGTATHGVVLTVSNILNVFATAKKKLKRLNVFDNLFAVISPDFEAVLMQYLAGKETALGDSTGTNGNIGKFYGFDLYVSNNCGWSGSLAYDATTPTAGDTVVINGVTFTFQTTIGTTAGNVLAVTDGVTSFTNLQNFINATSTTSANQVALSAANQALMRGITASGVSGATGAMAIKAEGKSYLQPTETLTPAADVWTAALQVQHQLFGKKGAITFVAQKYPTIEVKDVPDKLGKNILPWILYGLKTFIKAKDKLVDVKIRSDAF